MLSAWRVRGLHLDGPDAVPERAVRLLGRRVVWVALNPTTREVLDAGVAPKLIAALVRGEGASDLDRGAAFKGFELESDSWSATVRDLVEEAATHALAAYTVKFADNDTHLCNQLIQDAEQVARTRPDEGENYARERRATVDAIRGATLDLDVVGLVKVESPT
jgi:hypothetical protein